MLSANIRYNAHFDTRKEKAAFYAPFKQFAELFPVEVEIMRLLKSCGGKDAFKKFPVLLQKIESKIMLQYVGENMPGNVPFLTIHDSLILPNDKGTIINAKLLIKDHFSKCLSIQPKISESEALTPENAYKYLDAYVAEKVTNLEIKYGHKAPEEELEDYEEMDTCYDTSDGELDES